MKDSTEEHSKPEEEKKDDKRVSLIDIHVEEVMDQAPIASNDLVHGDDVGIVPVEDNSESPESTEVGSSTGSNKGKGKDRKAGAEEQAQQTKGTGLAGKINVLMAADVEAVLEGESSPARLMR